MHKSRGQLQRCAVAGLTFSDDGEYAFFQCHLPHTHRVWHIKTTNNLWKLACFLCHFKCRYKRFDWAHWDFSLLFLIGFVKEGPSPSYPHPEKLFTNFQNCCDKQDYIYASDKVCKIAVKGLKATIIEETQVLPGARTALWQIEELKGPLGTVEVIT